MKKFVILLMALMLLNASALADTIMLNPEEDRGIQFTPADVNDMEDGISPTTGRNLDEVAEEAPDGAQGYAVIGRYMPILVQISNPEGGVGYNSKKEATYNRAPWGAQYADVVYETILNRDGETRLSFLFSDVLPEAAGPVRSARAFHAWLREEWNAGFAFYGEQQATVPAIFKETGIQRIHDEYEKAQKGAILFSGTSGHWWKNEIYQVYPKMTLKDPNNMTLNVAYAASLIPDEFEPANHTWLFTDDYPDGADEATHIYVDWGVPSKQNNSIVEWDEDDECYYRLMVDQWGESHVWKTLRTEGDQEIDFQNVIVQFVEMSWRNKLIPYPTVTGTGNADYFMGGMHIPGVWHRDSISDRTVFYGPDGEEIELQRGRTLIIVMDYQTEGHSVYYTNE
ncbi:MAG: DUF3048 C-terminal domain-containing protein [Clostridia bacterium]|nr:DUF3048 C-terminal domain-containing protein [Clostridia bacterium]